MTVEFPKAGKYVVAVSGGVDSVVLLDLLRQRPELELVVAHFDHGMREASAEDRQFVHDLAHKHGMNFAYAEGQLGGGASEALAREHRYMFLRAVQKEQKALALITAHHQDDLLETAIINLLRGTGRKGLSSLASTAEIKRPLLAVPKSEILSYAKQHHLKWREDETNADTTYLRNYVRREILPRFSKPARAEFLKTLSSLKETNQELDALLVKYLPVNGEKLDRQWFNGLPHGLAREAMAAWLRQHGIRDFDRKMLERLVVAAKTGRPLSSADVLKGVKLKVNKKDLALVLPER